MDKELLIIFISALLLIAGFFSGFFRPTGFAVNDQKLLVSLDIPPDQQKIQPGQDILLEISLRVPGGNIDQTTNVDLEYSIRDLDGNVISSKIESGAVAVKESDVTSLLIPTNTKPGVYTAFVTATYQGENYTGSKTFEVVGNAFSFNTIIYILIGLILLVLLYIIARRIGIKLIVKKKKRRH